jgi:serine/threonine protein phosphatase PrpC
LADGAGGNRSLGINPADFPQAILAACRNILRQNNLQSHPLPELIKSAMQQVETSPIRGKDFRKKRIFISKGDFLGSSTLCLLTLDKQEHTLTSLNIGDSGFVICRNNEIYHRSTCTMSSDGCGPRQLFAIDGSVDLPCISNKR